MNIKDSLNQAIKYHQNDQIDKALPIYKTIIKKSSNHKVVLTILASIAQGHFQLAQALIQMGRVRDAISTLLHILTIRSDVPDVHFLLGKLYVRINNKQQASEHLRYYIKLVPQDESGAIMLLAHIGEAIIPKNSPKVYLHNFYDNYATTYDEHLNNRLNYRCPEIILGALKKNSIVNADILDLGCGTGLCGEKIKTITRRLDGVDLSRQMLNIARKKNIYNTLEAADVYEYMHKRHAQYDAIVAAGLFEHIGEINELFKNVHNALKTNGVFIFTTDENPDDGIGVNSSGFYMHGKVYVEKQAVQCGFSVVSIEKEPMWIENMKPVSGLLVTLKKHGRCDV